MITISPKSIALQFNECITNADLKGLANLMTEDHVFCDTANNRIKGKDNNIVQAWEPFFNFDPGYRNIFENIVARGSTVIMQGYSICSDEILNNICAIWVAKIIDNKVGSWHHSIIQSVVKNLFFDINKEQILRQAQHDRAK